MHDMTTMSDAIFICIVAFSVVFAVLILLTLLIYAMRGLGGQEKPAAPVRSVNKPLAEPAPKASSSLTGASVSQGSVASAAGVAPHVVAAITAAITAGLGGRPFKISSLRQRSEAKNKSLPSAWGEVSRLENMCGALREPWEF